MASCHCRDRPFSFREPRALFNFETFKKQSPLERGVKRGTKVIKDFKAPLKIGWVLLLSFFLGKVVRGRAFCEGAVRGRGRAEEKRGRKRRRRRRLGYLCGHGGKKRRVPRHRARAVSSDFWSIKGGCRARQRRGSSARAKKNVRGGEVKKRGGSGVLQPGPRQQQGEKKRRYE